MPNPLDIFFDAKTHTYKDSLGNKYTSVTTLLGEYGHKFDTWNVARACEKAGRKGNPKYRGKTAEQLVLEWKKETEKACAIGNDKHDYLETSIKSANGYSRFENTLFNGRLYTIADISNNPDHGIVDLDYFIKSGVKDRYPTVFEFIAYAVQNGYKLYPEIGVYNPEYLVSGLIDLLLIKDNEFLIGDWKTNKDPLRFESGYFEKDSKGFTTNNFILTQDYFKFPLNVMPYSKGNTYTMQLSLYAYLTELFGFKHRGNVLFHIQRVNEQGIEPVTIYKMDYKKEEVSKLLSHKAKLDKRKIQTSLII